MVYGSGLRDMKIQRFEELEAWHLARELMRDYRIF